VEQKNKPISNAVIQLADRLVADMTAADQQAAEQLAPEEPQRKRGTRLFGK
jgi:hypothetical protein